VRTLENHTDWVRSVAVTPDGRQAVTGSVDRTVRVWDLSSGEEVARFDAAARAHAVATGPDGCLVAGDSLGNVYFLKLEEGE
jgi:WD40 repeat protein